jgi:hypothetical protein
MLKLRHLVDGSDPTEGHEVAIVLVDEWDLKNDDSHNSPLLP